MVRFGRRCVIGRVADTADDSAVRPLAAWEPRAGLHGGQAAGEPTDPSKHPGDRPRALVRLLRGGTIRLPGSPPLEVDEGRKRVRGREIVRS